MCIEIEKLIASAISLLGLGVGVGYWIGINKNIHISKHTLTCNPLREKAGTSRFVNSAKVVLKNGKKSAVICSHLRGNKCALTTLRCELL